MFRDLLVIRKASATNRTTSIVSYCLTIDLNAIVTERMLAIQFHLVLLGHQTEDATVRLFLVFHCPGHHIGYCVLQVFQNNVQLRNDK